MRLGDGLARRGRRRARRSLGRAGEREPHLQLAAARIRGEPADARDEAIAHHLEHEAVRREEQQGSRIDGRGARRERANPGVELLRGQLLLQSAQASVPEILHGCRGRGVGGRGETKFYRFRFALSTTRAKKNASKNSDLTRLQRKGSNSA